MDEAFLSVISSRHCKRAFLDKPVPREILERVLSTAGHAPSTRNIQLWQVAVVTGAARDDLSQHLQIAADSAETYEPDYVNRPTPMDAVPEQRSFAWGAAYYSALGIARDDRAGRAEVELRNLRFYGAPTVMILHLPANAVAGTYLEMGFFLQNIMLGLVACGLGSCPQYTVARYSRVIRERLGLGSDRLVVCGLSVGYIDETASVNAFYPERAALDDYTQWHGDPAAGDA
jgi:nitroreductase